jgi:hypothetical protein
MLQRSSLATAEKTFMSRSGFCPPQGIRPVKLVAVALAFLLAVLPPGGASASEPRTPIEEASKIVDAFHGALTKGDGKAALALLDEQVQIYEQGWVERSKDEYASKHLESDMKFSAATTQSQTARTGAVVGDLAYISTEGRTAGKFEGKAVDSITLETVVLHRASDGWHIVHIHWSSRKAKK